MIRILRRITPDEVERARFDLIIREVMVERGYKLGHTGASEGTRFLEFDGASVQGEQRDFQNSILADALSIRLPGVFIEIVWSPVMSRA